MRKIWALLPYRPRLTAAAPETLPEIEIMEDSAGPLILPCWRGNASQLPLWTTGR